MTSRKCKKCGDEYFTYNNLQTTCPKCAKYPKAKKPISKQGKQQTSYLKWRNTVARPYLLETYGPDCAHCGIPPEPDADGNFRYHSIDHIVKRSTDKSRVKDLSNVQFLCATCHQLKDNNIKLR